MSRQIKSEGKWWSWTGCIILKLQENLQPTLSLTLSVEGELCTWPHCWAVIEPALTELCTGLGLFCFYYKGFIQTVCLPLPPYSAAAAHSALQRKRCFHWCLVYSHTHMHTFAGKHAVSQAYGGKKYTQASKHLAIEAVNKGTTAGTLALRQICKHAATNTFTPHQNKSSTYPSLLIHVQVAPLVKFHPLNHWVAGQKGSRQPICIPGCAWPAL